MASLNVNFLFTNVPLEVTISICVNELFKSNSSIHGLNKKQIIKILSLTTKESIILYFSFETEKDAQIPFLDANAFRENGKFVTNVYRKEAFTGVCTNFSSFIPSEHEFGLVYMLLNRCFCLVTDISKFHFEIEKLMGNTFI